MIYLALFIIPMVIGLIAQNRVSSTFRKYLEQPSTSGRTGAQIARAILDANGLQDVEVRAVPGELSDHYDPRDRSVNLSEAVYATSSVSAVSVAAHEVGHAIQHAQNYSPMQVRSAIFPAAALGTNMAMYLIMGGAILGMIANLWLSWLFLAGIALYSFAVLFQLVTLPVEFDASSRAKKQLQNLGVVSNADATGTAKVLNAAAFTYVAAALAAISQLLYFVLMYLNSRN